MDLGFEELVDSSAILVIEWGSALAPLLPDEWLDVEIRQAPDVEAESERQIAWRARGPGWAGRIGALRAGAEARLATLRHAEAPSPSDEGAPSSPRHQGDVEGWGGPP